MKPLEWIDGKLKFLDQTKLPLEEFFCETDDVVFVAEALRSSALQHVLWQLHKHRIISCELTQTDTCATDKTDEFWLTRIL
jgi:hypothetical protein